MAKVLQLRRGTTAENEAFTGAVGEVTVDTEKHTLRVHDGSTVGGTELALASDISNDYLPKSGGTVTGNLTVSGTLTATLTGNCSGSSGSCTGNAATASTATKWNGAAKTVSTAAASGGANGDIWFQYI